MGKKNLKIYVKNPAGRRPDTDFLVNGRANTATGVDCTVRRFLKNACPPR
jgi:hypothetical protein